MAFTLKDGQGTLFKNEKKEKPEHPNLSGSIRINGRDYWLSGWTKEGAKGKWISLSAKPKEQRSAPSSKQSFAESLDDDINF